MSRARARSAVHQTTVHQTNISSYERLARRIQAVISAPRAQAKQQAVISCMPDESPHDWERLLDEIRDTEGVHVTPRDDGSVHVSWYVDQEPIHE